MIVNGFLMHMFAHTTHTRTYKRTHKHHPFHFNISYVEFKFLSIFFWFEKKKDLKRFEIITSHHNNHPTNGIKHETQTVIKCYLNK